MKFKASLPHLEFHAVPAQDRKNEGEEAGGEPENGGRGEIVGLGNGGGRKFGTALDKVAADNVLEIGRASCRERV